MKNLINVKAYFFSVNGEKAKAKRGPVLELEGGGDTQTFTNKEFRRCGGSQALEHRMACVVHSHTQLDLR